MPPRFGGTAPKCPECGKSVYAAEEVKGPAGNSWHQLCFCCKNCGKSMRGGEWKEIGGHPHCHACHAGKESVYGPRGSASGRVSVTEDAGTGAPPEPVKAPAELAEPVAPAKAPQQNVDTGADTAGNGATQEESKPMSLKERMAALQHSHDKDQALSKDATPTHAKPKVGGRFSATAPICPKCSGRVYPAEEVKGPGGKSWHALCFCCKACGKSMRGGNWRDHAGEPHCQTCHGKLFGIKGVGFGNTLIDPGAKLTSEEPVPANSADAPEADVPEADAPAADAPEATKPMSLKERAIAFQAAADASASKAPSFSFQPEKRSNDAKEEAAGSEQQDKIAVEAENKGDDAHTSEAHPCMEDTSGEIVDHEIAKDETKAGDSTSATCNDEAEQAKTETEQVAATTVTEQGQQEPVMTTEEVAESGAIETAEQVAVQAEVNVASLEVEVADAEGKQQGEDQAMVATPAPASVPAEQPAAPVSEASHQSKPLQEGKAPAKVWTDDKRPVKCGFAKTAHETQQAAQENPVPICSDSQPEKTQAVRTGDVVDKPCSNYRLDVAGKSFGDCKCGYSKAAHDPQQQPEEESPTPASVDALPKETSSPETEDVVAKPCSQYKLDVAGKSFGDCKCGFSKAAHEIQQQAAEETPAPVPSAPETEDVATQPCSNFRLDVAGKSFGDCKCGFPKSAHNGGC